MKKVSAEAEKAGVAVKRAPPPLPPTPPPFSLKKAKVTMSVTNQEIAKFWKQKRAVEEEHLMAAIKAAARIRARKLTDEDYERFEKSLKEDSDSEAEDSKINENEKELRVGIKDWWTKSKYAYLNQPAIDKPKRRTSTYIPNFCNYKAPSLPPASFRIF